MTLDQLAHLYGTDKSSGWHGYTAAYERHFADLQHEPITLLEIGVQHGDSIRMWLDWFDHPDTRIIGIDNQPILLTAERFEPVECDVKRFVPDDTYDIVVDDGSHALSDVHAAFFILWSHVKRGGWYVIEDIDVMPGQAIPVAAGAQFHRHGDIVFLRKTP